MQCKSLRFVGGFCLNPVILSDKRVIAAVINNLLIILNDNDMAIDHNVGALNQYLVNITTSPSYNKLRYDIYRTLVRLKLISAEHRGAI